MNKLSKRTGMLALCGVICGLSIAIMLSSALLPGMSYALPMLAGWLLVVPSIEFGTKEALTSFVAVALLSLVLPTDKESALMYIFLFGLYPIVKKYLERIKLAVVEYLLKFVYFNAAAGSAVLLAFYFFGIPVSDGSLGKWTVPVLLLAGNVCFIVYDIAMTRLLSLYIFRLQPTLRKIFHI